VVLTDTAAVPVRKYISLIQDDREDVRPLDSRFGARSHLHRAAVFVRVEGRDADGHVLADICYQQDDQTTRRKRKQQR
jgi:hypothetical protein